MSPRTPEQFEEIRVERRQNILEAALSLFARYGFHNTSISQIAKAAGVSKGLIYNYFDSKEALLDQLITREIDQGEAIMEILEQHSTDPVDQLVMIVDGAFRMVEADLSHWKLLTMLALQEDVMQHISDALKRKTERGMALAEKIFERMGLPDPVTEAYFFGAALDGIFLHFFTLRDLDITYPVESLKALLIDRYRS